MNYNHLQYFENISRMLKTIGHTDNQPHFFKASTIGQLEGLITSLSIAQYPALVVFDKKDGRLLDRDSDNLVDLQYYQVMILAPADGLNSDSRQVVMDNCFSIFRSILSKMTMDKITDSRMPVTRELTGLRNLNRNEIVYNSLGPVFDNLHGIEFSFTIGNPINTAFKPGEWNG